MNSDARYQGEQRCFEHVTARKREIRPNG
jgi:hypothetical protein